MRLTKLTILLLAVILTAGTSLGLERPRLDDDSDKCRLIVEVIERHKRAIGELLDELSERARALTDAERSRLQERIRTGAEQGEQLADAVERVLNQTDPSCEELRKISARLSEALQTLRRLDGDIRTRLATRKRVGAAIRVTDRALVRAARLARKTENGVDAFPGLRRAFELQEGSKQELAAGRLEPAMKMTLRARDLIGRTMRAALDSAEVAMVRERAMRFWKQTDRMIRRIERRIDNDDNPRAARLLKMAKDEQNRARDLAEEHPYRAFRHAKAARRIVNEMLRFHRRAQHCEDRAELIGERLEDAEEMVEESGSEKAAQILDKGKSHYEKGVELCEAGNAGQATAQFDIAAKLTAKAVDVAKGNTRRDHALKREIHKTGVIVKRADAMAETGEQKEKVERARELVKEAGDNIDKPQVCLKLLDRATDLAFSVIAEAGRAGQDDGEDR
ncbi:MAG: hypothetical protein GF418_14040 [Chitinivibrionales bacterium]|nr:hypothetical protein [Chitinivibrionales bacterium]MBD3396739.1 hypothetical protein [Chitinivibrionales bacterium]